MVTVNRVSIYCVALKAKKRKDKKLGNKAIVENSKQIEQKKIVFEIVAKEGNWRKTFIWFPHVTDIYWFLFFILPLSRHVHVVHSLGIVEPNSIWLIEIDNILRCSFLSQELDVIYFVRSWKSFSHCSHWYDKWIDWNSLDVIHALYLPGYNSIRANLLPFFQV